MLISVINDINLQTPAAVVIRRVNKFSVCLLLSFSFLRGNLMSEFPFLLLRGERGCSGYLAATEQIAGLPVMLMKT